MNTSTTTNTHCDEDIDEDVLEYLDAILSNADQSNSQQEQ